MPWLELYEPENVSVLGIVTSTIKINLQGISDPPCGRSKGYLLPPITTQSIVPFYNKTSDKIKSMTTALVEASQ